MSRRFIHSVSADPRCGRCSGAHVPAVGCCIIAHLPVHRRSARRRYARFAGFPCYSTSCARADQCAVRSSRPARYSGRRHARFHDAFGFRGGMCADQGAIAMLASSASGWLSVKRSTHFAWRILRDAASTRAGHFVSCSFPMRPRDAALGARRGFWAPSILGRARRAQPRTDLLEHVAGGRRPRQDSARRAARRSIRLLRARCQAP